VVAGREILRLYGAERRGRMELMYISAADLGDNADWTELSGSLNVKRWVTLGRACIDAMLELKSVAS
jgi:hypothetical protein